MLSLPWVRDEDAGIFVDAVQRELKPEFVKRGLMIGELGERQLLRG